MRKFLRMESLYIHIANKLESARRGSKGFGSIREELRSWDVWRATAAEFVATFLFVFAGCASTTIPNSDVVKVSTKLFASFLTATHPDFIGSNSYSSISNMKKLKTESVFARRNIALLKNYHIFSLHNH